MNAFRKNVYDPQTQMLTLDGAASITAVQDNVRGSNPAEQARNHMREMPVLVAAVPAEGLENVETKVAARLRDSDDDSLRIVGPTHEEFIKKHGVYGGRPSTLTNKRGREGARFYAEHYSTQKTDVPKRGTVESTHSLGRVRTQTVTWVTNNPDCPYITREIVHMPVLATSFGRLLAPTAHIAPSPKNENSTREYREFVETYREVRVGEVRGERNALMKDYEKQRRLVKESFGFFARRGALRDLEAEYQLSFDELDKKEAFLRGSTDVEYSMGVKETYIGHREPAVTKKGTVHKDRFFTVKGLKNCLTVPAAEKAIDESITLQENDGSLTDPTSIHMKHVVFDKRNINVRHVISPGAQFWLDNRDD